MRPWVIAKNARGMLDFLRQAGEISTLERINSWRIITTDQVLLSLARSMEPEVATLELRLRS